MNAVAPIDCPSCGGMLLLEDVVGGSPVFECRECGETVTVRASESVDTSSVRSSRTTPGGRNGCNGGVTGGVLHQYGTLKPSTPPLEGGVTGVTGVCPTIARGGRVGVRACVRARNSSPITRYTRYTPIEQRVQTRSLSDWRNGGGVTGVLRPVTARGVGS